MAYEYSDLLTAARSWAERGLAAARLNPELTQPLFDMDSRSPKQLFSNHTGDNPLRPLIVAFMGGTGVGKSSLLNRLAGQAIARAGVERPTSKEVTLYLHQSLNIQHLPAGLPLDSVRISRHNDDGNSRIVWMDMPDFDSVQVSNQNLVLQWLPHIDVLLYVVSPERYRDNKAWQLLLVEGLKHAWLFVMNQWDRGQLVQYQDFQQQLHKAGFDNPLIFRTSCAEPVGDEFAELLAQLHGLSSQHNVEQLEQRTHQQQSRELQQVLLGLQADIANRDYRQLEDFYKASWQAGSSSLQQGLAWVIQQYAQLWAAQPGQKPEIRLWDDWAQSRFADALDQLVQQSAQLNIPFKPLKHSMQAIKQQAEKKICNDMELAGRQALLNPGNTMQRFFIKFTAIAETLLPLTAMTIVGYQVFNGYYQSTTAGHVYLGADFAVHSILLIALSWLIPFFINKKIQPSLQKNALKGLHKGLQEALLAIEMEINQVLQQEQSANSALQKELAELITNCKMLSDSTVAKPGLLGRVLL